MIAIHVGFAKTATSTLQRGVFSQHEGIDFLGLPARDPRLAAAIHAIAKADSVCFDTTQIRGVFRDHLNAARGRAINLISYENFTLYESRDKGMIARRLKDLFGDSKILFTLRRQEELVKAWYLQKMPKYISGSNFIEFDDWIDLKMQEPHKSIMDDLNFDKIIEYYEEVFRRERVEIFLFEHLRQVRPILQRKWRATSKSTRLVSQAFWPRRTTIRRSRSASLILAGSPRPTCPVS